MRDTLSHEEQKAASLVRYCAGSVKSEDIRPISAKDDDTMRSSRAAGLAVWQQREAFVNFFTWQDDTFNATLFRQECEVEGGQNSCDAGHQTKEEIRYLPVGGPSRVKVCLTHHEKELQHRWKALSNPVPSDFPTWDSLAVAHEKVAF